LIFIVMLFLLLVRDMKKVRLYFFTDKAIKLINATTVQMGCSMTRPFNLEPQGGERIWITGDTVVIRATAAETGGTYTMIEAIASPGNGPPPHIHKNEDETLYVLDGEFEILNGEHLMSAKQGALAFVPRGTVHRFRCVGNSTGRLLLVYTPGGIEGFFRESGIPAGGDGPAPPVSPAEIARTEKAGIRYGLQVVDWAHLALGE
jgi:quercetin dioxygenase-like cupin family protein